MTAASLTTGQVNNNSEIGADINAASLVRRLYEVEAENARFKKSEAITRKNQFRLTGAFLLFFGTAVALIAYPSYNYAAVSNVLMMVGVGAIFLGLVTFFLTTETFVTQKVAERFSLSALIVLDDLIRDLRLKNKGIYVPASKTLAGTKVFVPLRRNPKLPTAAQLKGDRAFLIGLSDVTQEGVLMQPLGYHLFRYTEDDLKVAWKKRDADESANNSEESNAHKGEDELSERLKDVLIKGLEIADSVVASNVDGRLRVSLQNTPYFSACHSIMEQAPLVCKQLGCPLCSLIACIYTEYVDAEVTIESVQRSNRNINVSCKVLNGKE